MNDPLASLVLLQHQTLLQQQNELKELREKVDYFMPRLSLHNLDTLLVDSTTWSCTVTFNIRNYLELGSHYDFHNQTNNEVCLATTTLYEYMSFQAFVAPSANYLRSSANYLRIGLMYDGEELEMKLNTKYALEMLDKLQALFQEVYDRCDQGNIGIVNNFNEFGKRCEIARNLVQSSPEQ